MLDAFSDEQLVESLRASDTPLPEIADHWADVEQAVAGATERSGEWLDDLVVLSGQLLRANLNENSETIADLAVKRGRDDADVYFLRGLARNNQGKFARLKPTVPPLSSVAGTTQCERLLQPRARRGFSQGNFAKAEEDYSAAIERGRNDSQETMLPAE